jgi:plasmid stabilization system protein ParE
MPHSFEEMRALAEHWINAWNARDLPRIMDHYAHDVEFEVNTAVTRWNKADGTLRGVAELREHFRRGLELAPDLHFDLEQIFFVPSGYAVLYRRENGNHVVDAVELDARGKAKRVKAFYASAQR